MTKVYKITLADIITLHEIANEYIMETDCKLCGDDLCEHCQRNYDLRQRLADARSLLETGCAVIFTSAEELVPRAEEKTAVIQ